MTVNKIKQNVYILKEYQLIHQAQVQEQCELEHLTRVKTAETVKILRKLSQSFIQFNESFFLMQRQTMLLTYAKNFV